MARVVGIGRQDFETIITKNLFYIDKTRFIKEWWENEDDVTLIARPRRFGKTLNLSMLEQFFSLKYAGRGELFQGLAIWQEEKYRQLQGTYPVISTSFLNTRKRVCQIIKELYNKHDYLLGSDHLNEDEKISFQKVSVEMEDYLVASSLNTLSNYLSRYYGKKLLSCWMSTMRLCRRRMCMGTGGKCRISPGICSMQRSRQICTLNGQL